MLQVISDSQFAFPLKASRPDTRQTNIFAWNYYIQPGERYFHLQVAASKKYIVYDAQGLRLASSSGNIFFIGIPTSQTGYFQLRTNYKVANRNPVCLNCATDGSLSVGFCDINRRTQWFRFVNGFLGQ